MNFSVFLNLLIYFFFQADLKAPIIMVESMLYVVGLFGIFRKSGFKMWEALIPCLREARLGEASDREREGHVMACVQGLLILMHFVEEFLFILGIGGDSGTVIADVVDISNIILGVVMLIYTIRVYLGLIEVYGQKKRWILLWSTFEFIPALIWGWFKEFKPQWTAMELQNEASQFFSNSKAAVLDQGLTVNLEERTSTEFFKKKYLLRDIHMYIQPGHMVLLLGGSGAGKTTYLNAINGYEKAKAEVVLNGRNMYKNYKEMQYDIGFVPQQDLMRGSDSVYRTLMDAASLRLPVDFSKAERRDRVEEVMKIFGLTPVQESLVSKLSGGQRKRLSIAMEFISNPSLFILDEPDSGLDGVMARELFLQLRQIADQGKIIIVITHTPDRVIDLFDDVIVLAKDANRTGRLAYFGPIPEAREFFGKEKMEEIVKSVNRTEEGGEGRADEFILKYAEVQHV